LQASPDAIAQCLRTSAKPLRWSVPREPRWAVPLLPTEPLIQWRHLRLRPASRRSPVVGLLGERRASRGYGNQDGRQL